MMTKHTVILLNPKLPRLPVQDSTYSWQGCASCLADRLGAVLTETKSTAYGDLGAKALPERLSRSWRLVRRSVAPSTDRKHSPDSVRLSAAPRVSSFLPPLSYHYCSAFVHGYFFIAVFLQI